MFRHLKTTNGILCLTNTNPTKPKQKKLTGSSPSFRTLQKSVNKPLLTKPNQKKLSGSSPSFRTLQKSINKPLLTKSNQTQPEEVVGFLSVQNLAKFNQQTCAHQIQLTQPEEVVRFFSFVQNLAEINQ
jgi:hypothetical protein